MPPPQAPGPLGFPFIHLAVFCVFKYMPGPLGQRPRCQSLRGRWPRRQCGDCWVPGLPFCALLGLPARAPRRGPEGAPEPGGIPPPSSGRRVGAEGGPPARGDISPARGRPPTGPSPNMCRHTIVYKTIPMTFIHNHSGPHSGLLISCKYVHLQINMLQQRNYCNHDLTYNICESRHVNALHHSLRKRPWPSTC